MRQHPRPRRPPTPPAAADDSSSTNQPPEAQDDILSTPYQTPITISNVLANDSDTDGDTLRVLTKSLPTHGTITRFGDIFTYTPDEGFSGIDSFVYTVGDDNGHIAFATVRITVNAPSAKPIPMDQLIRKTTMGDHPHLRTSRHPSC
ncbi:MAG: cadherin-like domain-containing protein [Candidatus Thiothrix singaporensis]|uniref:Cadherin-like domain-containing protein n=1 Tax=Candidatus Thiothrix singaporensis TaxID=2799669 RepID=A0A7L6AN93_9GAMM|nr:MAG: cadherin-like domain-containing protein [Candidatus Thiothrix singaporensis]